MENCLTYLLIDLTYLLRPDLLKLQLPHGDAGMIMVVLSTSHKAQIWWCENTFKEHRTWLGRKVSVSFYHRGQVVLIPTSHPSIVVLKGTRRMWVSKGKNIPCYSYLIAHVYNSTSCLLPALHTMVVVQCSEHLHVALGSEWRVILLGFGGTKSTCTASFRC